MHDDGRPFFYLADTAWELFHRLNREEADRYLTNRAEKGFTVIQAVVLAELDGLHTPNPYGHTPLHDDDPTRPNERYFEHVDFIVNRAAELGLVIGMLPTWGDKWQLKGGKGPLIFDTPAKARDYCRWLADRYKDKPVIWILGGDRNIEAERERPIIEAMARGLEAGDGGAHLITYHPRGPGRSSDYFHEAGWLDFNMVQSSHGARDHDNGAFIVHDRALKPTKPTLDGEPRYETIPVGFYNVGSSPLDRFDDFDVRQAAYWALLAGAAGHTYGHNSIWQMHQRGRESVISARLTWQEAIDHPGAFQMGYVRRLFESRPWHLLEPADRIVVNGPKDGAGRIRAAMASDGSFGFIYSPYGAAFTVDQSAFDAEDLRASWYDPRYGAAEPIHTGGANGLQTFTPPTSGRGNDWVLILDDASQGYAMPGAGP